MLEKIKQKLLEIRKEIYLNKLLWDKLNQVNKPTKHYLIKGFLIKMPDYNLDLEMMMNTMFILSLCFKIELQLISIKT